MMAFNFHAGSVESEHPEGVCNLVGFADKKYGTEIYFMLQRSCQDDEQDIELGMNTFHVEWCDQEASCYGGINKFVLKSACVEVYFEPEMTELFGGMQHLFISFDLRASEHLELKEALQRIFLGSNCLEFADALAG